MDRPPRTIRVEPGSELDRLLDAATGAPIVLERDGARYRIHLEQVDDIWDGYEPEAVVEAVRVTTGTWAAEDVDKMIADIYRWREEGSRPADSP